MDGLFLRGQDGYEEARIGRVFNRRRPSRYPDAVLIAADADAVAEGVRLARSRGWPVAVRSGGHSWAVWSVRDGGLLIDLQNLNHDRVRRGSGIAVAGPSVRGGRNWPPSSRPTGGRSRAGTARRSGSAGSCSRAGRAGTADRSAGRARAWSPWTWSRPRAIGSERTRRRTATSTGRRAGRGPGSRRS